METEFDDINMATKRSGFSSVEAAQFLNKEMPGFKWMVWGVKRTSYGQYLQRIPAGIAKHGAVGKWTWETVPVSYPVLPLWWGKLSKDSSYDGWTGLIKIKPPKGKEFMMFGFISGAGYIGLMYMVSTDDMKLLAEFGAEVENHYGNMRDKIRVSVVGGSDVYLKASADEPMFLKEEIRLDIERQVLSFFDSSARSVFQAHGVAYRRGLLLVGDSGTGKTMMMRNLIRQCWNKYRVHTTLVKCSRNMDEDTLEYAFNGATDKGLCLVILEDLDSFTGNESECRMTRSGLLNILDGLDSRDGVMVIASTNYPEKIDPALVHRPSRFDRVWRFELPDLELRRQYLALHLKGLDESLVIDIAEKTEGWSFAYLNELRTTAAMLSIGSGRKRLDREMIMEAYGLMSSQFKSGKKCHVKADDPDVGFAAA